MDVTDKENQIIEAIADGLPLVDRPYAALGAEIGTAEEEVLRILSDLRERGVIRRFGVIVRHHELGYAANAMVVWDVPDAIAAETGRLLAEAPGVTLCYRRPRRPPRWPYNLFCMIHGRDRDGVIAQVEAATRAAGLADMPRAVLFSRRRFKQRGARYGSAVTAPAGES